MTPILIDSFQDIKRGAVKDFVKDPVLQNNLLQLIDAQTEVYKAGLGCVYAVAGLVLNIPCQKKQTVK